MLRTIVMVGIGGMAGSMARYAVKLLTDKYLPATFPYSTFIVNMAGCFLIGLLYGLLQRQQLSENTWLILAAGFCGGFTTFSAFALEGNMLMADKLHITALLYLAVSVLMGILLCRAGILLTR